jgi:CubicO group peptidase (beta-lactamase class C family)
MTEAVRVVQALVDRGAVPGAVLLVVHRGRVAIRRAFGDAALRPCRRPTEPDTLYDLASLTKPFATATALALLYERAAVRLDDPAGRFLPDFARQSDARSDVTVRHLLTHTAGLPAGGAYAGRTVTLREIVAEIATSRRIAPPGAAFLYSDFSAIVLGAIVEAVTQQRLDQFCQDRIFGPLHLTDTRFRPGAFLAPRCASTSDGDDTAQNRGRVHDPTAVALERAGDVAGHAGLFSTADDLARLGAIWGGDGSDGGTRLLAAETVAIFRREHAFGRALGWDVASDYAVRGELTPGSFGHTGFTGTSIWIDPTRDVCVLLLTNAVHAVPVRRDILPARRALSTAVARAIVL